MSSAIPIHNTNSWSFLKTTVVTQTPLNTYSFKVSSPAHVSEAMNKTKNIQKQATHSKTWANHFNSKKSNAIINKIKTVSSISKSIQTLSVSLSNTKESFKHIHTHSNLNTSDNASDLLYTRRTHYTRNNKKNGTITQSWTTSKHMKQCFSFTYEEWGKENKKCENKDILPSRGSYSTRRSRFITQKGVLPIKKGEITNRTRKILGSQKLSHFIKPCSINKLKKNSIGACHNSSTKESTNSWKTKNMTILNSGIELKQDEIIIETPEEMHIMLVKACQCAKKIQCKFE